LDGSNLTTIHNNSLTVGEGERKEEGRRERERNKKEIYLCSDSVDYY
jgi:hypothetical protein